MYLNNGINWMKIIKDKKIFIFGAGKQGKRFANCLKSVNYAVVGFIDNNINLQGTKIDEIEVFSFSSYLAEKEQYGKDVIVAITSKYSVDIKAQLLAANEYYFFDISEIDIGGGSSHYDDTYFEFQKPLGEFGGKRSAKFFQQYVKSTDTLVEFGSAGGYLLKAIQAERKMGIEINPFARKAALELGINSVADALELDENYADVIISTHVLEHCESPLNELRKLYKILKDGGLIIFEVPSEENQEYIKNDINNHLYTWTCLNLGNLFKAAGFHIKRVELISTAWPTNFETISSEVSEEFFDELCKLNGTVNNKKNCLVVAEK